MAVADRHGDGLCRSWRIGLRLKDRGEAEDEDGAYAVAVATDVSAALLIYFIRQKLHKY